MGLGWARVARSLTGSGSRLLATLEAIKSHHSSETVAHKHQAGHNDFIFVCACVSSLRRRRNSGALAQVVVISLCCVTPLLAPAKITCNNITGAGAISKTFNVDPIWLCSRVANDHFIGERAVRGSGARGAGQRAESVQALREVSRVEFEEGRVRDRLRAKLILRPGAGRHSFGTTIELSLCSLSSLAQAEYQKWNLSGRPLYVCRSSASAPSSRGSQLERAINCADRMR